MTEPIEITVLRLFREFGSPPAVAKYLGIRYGYVLEALDKEFRNLKEARKLSKTPLKEWPNKYRPKNPRKAAISKEWREKKKQKEQQIEVLKEELERLDVAAEIIRENKKPSITFGYGGNNLLNKDKPTKNNNYYLNERKALL